MKVEGYQGNGELVDKAEVLVDIVASIRKGKFTKEVLESRGGELVAPGMTLMDLIEGSFDLANVHWVGDVLMLGKEPIHS